MREPRGERHASMQAKRCVSPLRCRQPASIAPGSFKGLAVIIVTGALSLMACAQAQDAVGSGEGPTAYYNPSTYSYYSSFNVTAPAATGPILVINQQVPGAPVQKSGFPSFGYDKNGSAWVYVPISIGTGKSGIMDYPQGTVPGLSYKSGQIVYDGEGGEVVCATVDTGFPSFGNFVTPTGNCPLKARIKYWTPYGIVLLVEMSIKPGAGALGRTRNRP